MAPLQHTPPAPACMLCGAVSDSMALAHAHLHPVADEVTLQRARLLHALGVVPVGEHEVQVVCALSVANE